MKYPVQTEIWNQVTFTKKKISPNYSVKFKTAALPLGSDTNSSVHSRVPFPNFGNVFERVLLVMGVQQLEEILGLARTKLLFFTCNCGCGIKRYKGGAVREKNILWIFYLLCSGKLAQILNLFVCWNLISSL